MPSPDDLRVLRKEIEADQAAVRPLADELRHARATLGRDPTQKDLAYLAYLLHGIYNAWESAMHRIAVLFENRLDPAQWHAQLLRRMSLDLPKIRPALITDELRLQLEKLRSFRHFFRHSYGAPLRKPELDLVLASYDQAATPFDDCLSRFLDDVKQIADQSEEP